MFASHISKMFKGWFVGDFEPSVFKTSACEAAIKKYSKNEYEPLHFHKISTEITILITGRIRMSDKIWENGSIIIIEPNDRTSFEALEDSVIVVIKIPSVPNDKYLC